MRTNADAARFAIYGIVAANVIAFAHQDRLERWFGTFSVFDGSLPSMFSSMFSHADNIHLVVNMLGLWRYSREVFVDTSSKLWQSPLTVLTVYLGSGLGGFGGAIALSYLFEKQWHQRLEQTRSAARCTHWLCQTLGSDYLTQPAADMFTHIYYMGDIGALWHYKLAHRIGASGAVYGVLGARLYTAFFSPWHRKLTETDALLFAVSVGYELSQSPLTLGNLREGLLVGDNVDHAGHIFGLICGWLLAAGLERFGRRGDGRGSGRRLGRI